MNDFEYLLTLKKLPRFGICRSLYTKRCKDIFKRFYPTWKEKSILYEENKPIIFWGCGEKSGVSDEYMGITPLRQTILLLCNEIYKDKYDKKRKKSNLLKGC